MAEIPYFDPKGGSAGVLEVDETVFGKRVHLKLLHQVVQIYEGNRRQGNASTKDKGAVQGSGRKPWPQKRLGRARVGSIRSPIWKGGGIVHGPHPRSHRRDISKSMRRTALNSVLLGKIRDGELRVIEELKLDAPKTKEMRKVLDSIGIEKSLLIGVDSHDKNRWLSARNLPRVSMMEAGSLNAYDILKHKDLLLTKAAFEKLVTDRKGTVSGPKGAKKS